MAPEFRADGWPVATPSEAALVELTALIDQATTIPNVHALVIEHQGHLVFERYWPGEDWLLTGQSLGIVEHGPTTLHDIRSVTKSVTSLLLGIALEGADEAALMRPIASFFPERTDLSPAFETITLHQVLTMTAGLAWNETIIPYNERNDFVRMFTARDPVGYVLAKHLHEAPGSSWNYNSGLTDLTAAVIEKLTGKPFAQFAGEVLFGPLGITDYAWHTPQTWGPDHFPSASAGLRLSARDLAKIGSLVLHGGLWQGQRIVPQDWIEVSTARHVPDVLWDPPGVYGYGYFWFPGTLLSGHEVIRAVGYGDQRIFVLPELDLAITVLAGNHASPRFNVGERITGRVVRALR